MLVSLTSYQTSEHHGIVVSTRMLIFHVIPCSSLGKETGNLGLPQSFQTNIELMF
jgi:hypothetical protein